LHKLSDILQRHSRQTAPLWRLLRVPPTAAALFHLIYAGQCALYAFSVASRIDRSPTLALILGLIITLATVVTYSVYITHQISGLRDLQRNLVDRNRKDSIQLLRIQNDLNSLGLSMRDMLGAEGRYPIDAWANQFARIHDDMANALEIEASLSPDLRTPDQQQFLQSTFDQFFDVAADAFDMARNGDDVAARDQIRLAMQPRQEALASAVSRLLVANNESEEIAAAQIREIYERVQRQVYFFLAVTLAAIVLTSIVLISSNRRLFAQLAALSQQRSELAQRLITTQESTLRHISRELHDEFGQILTAIGSLLSRSERLAPEGSVLREDLHEVRDITQTTLNNVRSLSQALHPVMLEESGLESTVDWYIPTVQKQSGVVINYEKSGTSFPVEGSAAIHIYRVLQEALNNMTRHSKATTAWVRLRYLPSALELEVEDNGIGLKSSSNGFGMGMVAMRERAELLGAELEIGAGPRGGTRVDLKVPREKVDIADAV
jgi:signal transduction histidine kinase